MQRNDEVPKIRQLLPVHAAVSQRFLAPNYVKTNESNLMNVWNMKDFKVLEAYLESR